MAAFKVLVVLTVIAVVNAQRPFYAGLSPIGIPAVEQDLLANRFGEDEPLPIEAKGDRNLINRLEKMPVDNQPFWYLNWKKYDELRRNPQTYPVRQSPFAESK
ncbi:unnamed protein product [Chrysodeixis includens]|uniref:Seminal fluid protein HACP044 n=1 Tax=Chrysodeixis includens TaxID=689277 RepID=A0A9P0FVF6_CHRIL|nr:unnamed protein product [Chrysodeixis includens]